MLRIFLFIVTFFSLSNSFAQEQEIQATVQSFFKGFHQRDTTAIQQVCMDTLSLQSVSESSKGTFLKQESFSKFLQSIASISNSTVFEERILSHTIHVDGAMAIDWTPYEFYVNGKKSHSGVNVFTLYNDHGQWKIVAIIDTRRK